MLNINNYEIDRKLKYRNINNYRRKVYELYFLELGKGMIIRNTFKYADN